MFGDRLGSLFFLLSEVTKSASVIAFGLVGDEFRGRKSEPCLDLDLFLTEKVNILFICV